MISTILWLSSSVKKFGGTSVADKERIFNVAKRCIEDYRKGNEVVVVLSAMGKFTDVLVQQARDINPNPPKREMDMLYTIGEQQCSFFAPGTMRGSAVYTPSTSV